MYLYMCTYIVGPAWQSANARQNDAEMRKLVICFTANAAISARSPHEPGLDDGGGGKNAAGLLEVVREGHELPPKAMSLNLKELDHRRMSMGIFILRLKIGPTRHHRDNIPLQITIRPSQHRQAGQPLSGLMNAGLNSTQRGGERRCNVSSIPRLHFPRLCCRSAFCVVLADSQPIDVRIDIPDLSPNCDLQEGLIWWALVVSACTVHSLLRFLLVAIQRGA
ncbi:uncharacterized protein N7459_002546 [Penicillium hispanicum]|uniref:uncharacterized protein n=1 Tax=Penicillium hispanicum TaxID=1080232 RepID=UPI0025413FCF|nr:uncharacterized protein N7459_002546 [Penicillium hispanicum]KAJ5586781.1 hypothetical protein N7459_002546 [Penicillium hispanicum]